MRLLAPLRKTFCIISHALFRRIFFFSPRRCNFVFSVWISRCVCVCVWCLTYIIIKSPAAVTVFSLFALNAPFATMRAWIIPQLTLILNGLYFRRIHIYPRKRVSLVFVAFICSLYIYCVLCERVTSTLLLFFFLYLGKKNFQLKLILLYFGNLFRTKSKTSRLTWFSGRLFHIDLNNFYICTLPRAQTVFFSLTLYIDAEQMELRLCERV